MRRRSRPAAASGIQAGFTLIELVVTVAIVAILGTLAAPSLQNFLAKIRMNGVSTQFTGNLLRARSEAVNRNTCTVMCMSSTTATAMVADANGVLSAGPSCATSGVDWQAGWLVFFKADCMAPVEGAALMPVNLTDYIAVQAPTPGDIHLDSTGTSFTRFFFNASGRRQSTASGANPGTVAQQGSFSLYYQTASSRLSQQFGQTICVDPIGRTRAVSSGQSC